jgi:hypothetical protein
MMFIRIVLAILCSNRLFANANLRGNIDNGDIGQDLQRGKGKVARPQYVPGEFLVRFMPGASNLNHGQAIAAANSEAGKKILTATMRGNGDAEGVTVMRIGMAVPEAVQAMIASRTVVYAEPNYVYTHDATSNDYYMTTNSQLWGMYSSTAVGGGGANQYGIGATTAWQNNKTDCSSIHVGIIDEGVMFTHPDLAANAGTNPGETTNDGTDNDGNGFKDDVNGWDFVNNNNTVYDDGTGDAHGMHVDGTIGGVGGNRIGIAGICWKVNLLSAKFLGSTGGTLANAIKAVDYFTNLKKKGVNIVTTNNSWGGGGYSQGLYDAIKRTNAAGGPLHGSRWQQRHQ